MRRNLIAILLIGGFSVPPLAIAQNTGPTDFNGINAQLDGKTANIGLADGRLIKKAKSVHLGQEWTDWQVGDSEGRAHTDDVMSVSVQRGRRTLMGFGIGAGVGLVLGIAVGDSEEQCSGEFCLDPVDESQLGVAVGVAAAALGTGIGAALTKGFRVRVPAPAPPFGWLLRRNSVPAHPPIARASPGSGTALRLAPPPELGPRAPSHR